MSMVMIFFNKFNTFWEHFDKRLGLLLRVFSKVPKGSCLCHPHSCVGADGNKNGAVVGVRTTKEWKQVCLWSRMWHSYWFWLQRISKYIRINQTNQQGVCGNKCAFEAENCGVSQWQHVAMRQRKEKHVFLRHASSFWPKLVSKNIYKFWNLTDDWNKKAIFLFCFFRFFPFFFSFFFLSLFSV